MVLAPEVSIQNLLEFFIFWVHNPLQTVFSDDYTFKNMYILGGNIAIIYYKIVCQKWAPIKNITDQKD